MHKPRYKYGCFAGAFIGAMMAIAVPAMAGATDTEDRAGTSAVCQVGLHVPRQTITPIAGESFQIGSPLPKGVAGMVVIQRRKDDGGYFRVEVYHNGCTRFERTAPSQKKIQQQSFAVSPETYQLLAAYMRDCKTAGDHAPFRHEFRVRPEDAEEPKIRVYKCNRHSIDPEIMRLLSLGKLIGAQKPVHKDGEQDSKGGRP